MTDKSKAALLWDLLTFDRLVTGPVIHLIYWAGLGVISLVAFSSVGAAVGVALREDRIDAHYQPIVRLGDDAGASSHGKKVVTWSAGFGF